MALSDAEARQIANAVLEALGRARPAPTPTPGHVTEVVFRMGAPEAVRALVPPAPANGTCCRPPTGELLDTLPFTDEDNALIQQLITKLAVTREQLLTTLLLRVIERELRGFAGE